MIKRRDYRMLHQEDGLAAASSDDSSSSSDDDDNVASRRPSSHPPPPLTLRPSQPLSHRSHPPSLCLRLSPPASTEEDQEVQGGGGDSEEGESGRGESESDSEESEEEGGGAVGVSSQWEELVSEEEREREEEKRRKKRRKKGRKSGSSDSDSSTSDDSSDGGEEGEEDGEEDEEEEGEEGEERGEEEGGKAGKRKRKGQREGEAFKDMDFGEGGEMVVRVVGQGGGGVLRCRVCPRVLCVNSDNMKKHLASKKHVAAVGRHGRGELQVVVNIVVVNSDGEKHVAAVGRHERGELQVVVNSDGEVEAIGETHAERFERTKAAAAAAAADAAAAAAAAAAAESAAATPAAAAAGAGGSKKQKGDGGRQRQQRRKQLQQQKKKKLSAAGAAGGDSPAAAAAAAPAVRGGGVAGAPRVPGTPGEAARSGKVKKGGAAKASGGNASASGTAPRSCEGAAADGSGVGGAGDKCKKGRKVKDSVKGLGQGEGSAALRATLTGKRSAEMGAGKEGEKGMEGGLTVDVIPSTFNEDLNKAAFASAGDYAAETATHKAIEVSSKALRDAQATGEAPPTLVIAADTVVEIDGELLEKPVSKEDAIRMLLLLSGRKHRVFTGVALVLPAVTDPLIGRSPLLRSFHECTQVEFASLSQAEVEAYVATGEPMDKAGGYGIQGLGGCLVKAINGCYFNVMGLPLNRLASEIDQLITSKLINLDV
ncbi:unnamed protein product [Closterium sp. NIES-64]|nr:unnamed protein product [Closterium sp. NIES-64]